MLYVVKGLKEPLLGRPAIEGLNLIARVNEVSTGYTEGKAKEKVHPNLFSWSWRNLKGSYKIKLKPDAKPHAIMTPRRVALPLKAKARERTRPHGETGHHPQSRGVYPLVCGDGSRS